MTEPDYWQLIVWVSGAVQTVLYLDFFYNYIKSKQKNLYQPVQITLPV
jgi:ER lumen protein retaining receptor